MELAAAQSDLRRAYTDAGPGIIVSGLVWLIAAYAEAAEGLTTGFIVLFVGGMFIYPGALLVNRVILRRAKEQAGNPGGPLVLEGTVTMIAGLVAAWLFIPYRPDLVMPIAAIMVGTHYLVFKTAYGMKEYYLLAALVTLVGSAAIFQFVALPIEVTLLVAIIELAFGGFITIRALRRA